MDSKRYTAKLLKKSELAGTMATQRIEEFEITRPEGFPTTTPGSSIGIYPQNSPNLVDKLLSMNKFDGSTNVTINDKEMPLIKALTEVLELSQLTRYTLQNYLKFIDIDYLTEMMDEPEQINILLEGKDIVDFLQETPIHNMTIDMLLTILGPIKPKYFFISKREETEDTIQFIATEKIYKHLGAEKKDHFSTYLLDQLKTGQPLIITHSPQKSFTLPANHAADIIMIGAEAGICPFRSFIHHRKISQATGKSWLMFSAQNEDTDFIYKVDIEEALENGHLCKLDTAYKADRDQSIYIQHKVREHKDEIIDWVQKGAHLYVCADTDHKVTIVHNTIIRAITEVQNIEFETAEDYLFELERLGQYQRFTF